MSNSLARWRSVAVLCGYAGLLLCFAGMPAEARAQEWTKPAWVLDQAGIDNYRRSNLIQDQQQLRSNNPDAVKVRRIVHYYLSQLLLPNQNLPKNVLERLLSNEINMSLTSAAAKEIAMKEVLDKSTDLFHHPDPIVAFNAVLLPTLLNVKGAEFRNNRDIPAVPYGPAYKVLIQAIQDEKLGMDARIVAAAGLARLCQNGESSPSTVERSEIATAVIATLKKTPPSSEVGPQWFRLRLIETLGLVDRLDNTLGQPVVIDALMEVLIDKKEVWQNRAEAAHGLSRLPFNADVNVGLITYETMKLLQEMTAAQMQAPQAGNWRESFVPMYLTFRPETAQLAKDKRWGLLYQVERSGLSTHAPLVKSAWDAAFPIVKPFVENTRDPIPQGSVTALKDWLAANVPASRKVISGGQTFAGN